MVRDPPRPGHEDDHQGCRRHHGRDNHQRRRGLGLNTSRERPGQPLARPLYLGLAVASIGGPLALAALYLPGAAGGSLPSVGLTTALAAAVFVAPLAVWLGYSRQVASSAGLAAFVDAAAGRAAAWGQALVWAVSYFLYLPYTVTYIAYDLLPIVFPGIGPYRPALQLLLPAAITLAVFAPIRWLLSGVLALAATQLVLMLLLGVLEVVHVGAPGSSFVPNTSAHATARDTAAISLLFLCASLPLFFGGEVQGGNRTVRAALLTAFLVVAACTLFAVVPLAAIPQHLRGSAIPGLAIAQAYGGRQIAIAVGVATAASVAALIVVEYLALGRLAHAMLRTPLQPTLAAIAVPFIAADAISLINPQRFYNDLLRPSLVALFLSQLVVFAVYPRFRRIHERLRPQDLAVAVIASALVIYGIYTTLTNSAGT